MPLGVHCHIDVFQECVQLASAMQVSVLQLCGIIDGIPQFLSPSRQAIFLYIVLQLILNKRKSHTFH